MSITRFERFLPWTGAMAGALWAGQMFIGGTHVGDVPGGATPEYLREHAFQNMIHLALFVAMGISLIFFAAAVQHSLEGGGSRTASFVALGGFLVMAAGLSQAATAEFALSLAGEDSNAAAVTAVGYLAWPGWLTIMTGLSASLLAMGIGGLHRRLMPRWFAVTTIACGGMVTLGALHIPPGGMIMYLLLPLWLIGASAIVAGGAHERSLVMAGD